MKALWKDRRRAQAGTTLVELLVSVTIIGLALVLIVGTISTGLLNSTVAKRNTATEAVVQYELDRISGSSYTTNAQSYSECFATENDSAPVPPPGGYQQPCPGGAFSLRADVCDGQVMQCVPTGAAPSPTTQVWTVSVVSWPSEASIGTPILVYKVSQ